MEKPNLLVVDDDIVFARSLGRVFRPHYDCQIATNARDARRIATEHSWSALVVDVFLDDGNGVDLAEEIASAHPSAAVAIVTARMVESLGNRVASLGWTALYKADLDFPAHARRFAERVRQKAGVRADADPLDPILRAIRSEQNLGARETEVLSWVARGYGRAGIAERTGLSEHTIKSYLARLTRKMGVDNVEAVRRHVLERVIGTPRTPV